MRSTTFNVQSGALSPVRAAALPKCPIQSATNPCRARCAPKRAANAGKPMRGGHPPTYLMARRKRLGFAPTRRRRAAVWPSARIGRRRTAIDLSQELRMKGLNQKKSDKKKPAKTMKEKKAEKAAKKAAKGR
jgi:hypothetical protein